MSNSNSDACLSKQQYLQAYKRNDIEYHSKVQWDFYLFMYFQKKKVTVKTYSVTEKKNISNKCFYSSNNVFNIDKKKKEIHQKCTKSAY